MIMGWLRARRDDLLALARAEGSLTAILGLFAVAMLGFAELSDEVSDGEAQGFDHAVLNMLRTQGDQSDPIGPAWFELAVFDFTALGSLAVLGAITLIGAGYLLMIGRPGKAAMLAAALGGGVTLSEVLKGLFERARPPEIYWMTDVMNHSFPSGHALMSAVVFLTLGIMLARAIEARALRFYVVAMAALLAILVGLSRIYLGVHWTTDVLAGWSIGAAWASALWLADRWLNPRSRDQSKRMQTVAG